MAPEKQAVTGRDISGRFKSGHSGNPAGRPPSLSPELRQRLDEVAPALFDSLIESALAGDVSAAKLILDRVAPVSKATTPPVSIPEMVNAHDLSSKANYAMKAIAEGQIPPDVGVTVIQALGACAKIVEVDELDRRITALEEIQNGKQH